MFYPPAYFLYPPWKKFYPLTNNFIHLDFFLSGSTTTDGDGTGTDDGDDDWKDDGATGNNKWYHPMDGDGGDGGGGDELLLITGDGALYGAWCVTSHNNIHIYIKLPI